MPRSSSGRAEVELFLVHVVDAVMRTSMPDVSRFELSLELNGKLEMLNYPFRVKLDEVESTLVVMDLEAR